MQRLAFMSALVAPDRCGGGSAILSRQSLERADWLGESGCMATVNPVSLENGRGTKRRRPEFFDSVTCSVLLARKKSVFSGYRTCRLPRPRKQSMIRTQSIITRWLTGERLLIRTG